MKRVVVITEGQTEVIFVRALLLRLFDPSKISFECITLNADKMQRVREYEGYCPEVHYEIINVQNDERVLAKIKEMEVSLVEKGRYDKIIGLRDMYSSEYDKRSHGVIDRNLTKQIMDEQNAIIAGMRYKSMIRLHYCIMEIEAWFLSMYNLFQKIHSDLSADNIASKLGYDLRVIDPQEKFFKPSKNLSDIFELVGGEYKKKKSDVEGITSKMDIKDFENAREENRCSCFNDFCQEIR